MMKKTNLFKTLTAITTAALMFALPVSSAFADVHGDTPDVFRSDVTPSTFDIENGATSTGDVYIKISNDNIYPTVSNEGRAVYKVDVKWTNLEFTYSSGTWNPETHTYSTGGTLSNSGKGSITVTNHSNWAVNYTAGFGTDNSDTVTDKGFTATLDNCEASIDACPIGASEATGASVAVPSETIGVTVTASNNVTATENFKLGTITVTITPDADGTSNAPISGGTT